MGAMTVLVIEEDPAIREICAMLLVEEGYAVVTVVPGTEVIGQVQQQLALVVLDVSGRAQVGIALCRELKATITPPPTVILLSTHPHLAELQAQAGADAALLKPFDIEDFLAIVHRWAAPLELIG